MVECKLNLLMYAYKSTVLI